MNIDLLEKQLTEWESKYRQWSAPIDRAVEENLLEVNKADYTFANFENDINRVRERQFAVRDPFPEIHALLVPLCAFYIVAEKDHREAIRKAVRGKGGVINCLCGAIQRGKERLHSSEDQEWLRFGLAAASIEDGGSDFRDILKALAELWVAAEKVGIDPKPHFQEIAKISNDAPVHPDGTSISSMLANFHTYAVLKEQKGEFTLEDKQAMREEVEKLFEVRFPSSAPKVPWWKRIFGGPK